MQEAERGLADPTYLHGRYSPRANPPPQILGSQLMQIIEQGNLVPDALVCDILAERVA